MAGPKPEILTIKDWEDLNYPMVWSIYHRASHKKFENFARKHRDDNQTWHEAYGRIELDLTAPPGAPDGLHQVHYDDPNYTGAGSAAIIANGRFHARTAAYAAMLAACDALKTRPGRLDHVYIEAWRYDQETGRLYVTLGS